MTRIESRLDLLAFLREHAPLSSMRRALSDGSGIVELYGGFREIPPHARPGWIVSLTSRHGRTWILAVVPDGVRHRFDVYRLDAVPWQWWDGDRNNELFDGDRPDEYKMLRVEAQE